MNKLQISVIGLHAIAGLAWSNGRVMHTYYCLRVRSAVNGISHHINQCYAVKSSSGKGSRERVQTFNNKRNNAAMVINSNTQPNTPPYGGSSLVLAVEPLT